MIQSVDWAAISAPLCLAVAGIVALLVDVFAPARRRSGAFAVALVGVGAALLCTIGLRDTDRQAFCMPSGFERPVSCSWIVDDVTVTWWVVMLVATGVVALILQPLTERDELPAGELYFLLLASATGALGVAASLDLITLVVSMETVTLPVFALIGLRRRDRLGAEAAVKFFVASVVATAFTLLGISMVYGATGSVLAGPVATAAATGAAITPVVGVGMVLTVVGLCFKVAVVPFQMWVPDTYVGAPVGVAAYLSVVSKVAGLAGLAVVLGRFFPSYDGTWSPLLAVAAAVTMTLGNLAALRQRNLVRLLAWSSVAQAGYLLVPLAAEGADGLPAMQAYALMYAVVNLGAFAVVTAMALTATASPQADVAPSAKSSSLGGLSSGSSYRGVLVEDAAGLVRRSPLLGAALAFALLCLAGLPPGVVGLLAKVVIFQSAVDGRLTWLAIVMAINVAIGLVYYLRVLVVVLGPGPTAEGGEPRAFVPWPVLVGAGGCLAAAVALSVVPAPLFSALP